MVTDPIGDFITQLKNAGAIKKATVVLSYSKVKHAIAEKLKERGFVASVEKKSAANGVPKLVVGLAYDDRGHKIHDVKRISKPGRRLYRAAREAHSVKRGQGALILSTPRGILTDAEARKVKAGGEALFEIW
jgi:small subunit ribosomal protein S8